MLLADQSLVTAATIERFMPEHWAPLAAASAESPYRQPLSVGNVREYQNARFHSTQTLKDALLRHHGNQTQAAQSLGLTLRQFGYRLRKAGLR